MQMCSTVAESWLKMKHMIPCMVPCVMQQCYIDSMEYYLISIFNRLFTELITAALLMTYSIALLHFAEVVNIHQLVETSILITSTVKLLIFTKLNFH